MKFKARVEVRLRKAVSDSAGNAVMAACGRMSDMTFDKLRLGKLIEIDFEAPDKEHAEKEIEMLSDRLFANVVIEDYEWSVNSNEN